MAKASRLCRICMMKEGNKKFKKLQVLELTQLWNVFGISVCFEFVC